MHMRFPEPANPAVRGLCQPRGHLTPGTRGPKVLLHYTLQSSRQPVRLLCPQTCSPGTAQPAERARGTRSEKTLGKI